jgi:Kef-type K+ transport system membrane component KefB
VPGHETLLLQLAVVLAAALAGGVLARRAGFPSVVGELCAGLLLGPTVLGRVLPGAHAWLLRPEASAGRDVVLQLGMICFLFVAGLEVDLAKPRRMGRAVAATGLLGVFVPLLLGAGAVLIAPAFWRPYAGRPDLEGLFALLVGTALSITALPVIARTLMELGLARGSVGTLILGAAALNDLVGWALFALVLSLYGNGDARSPWMALAIVGGVAATLLTAGRWLAARVRRRLGELAPGSLIPIAVAAIVTLLGAAGGVTLGLHGVLGAFLAGVAVTSGGGPRSAAYDAAYQFALGVFAPLYFASVGLQMDLAADFDPLLCAVVLAIACAGKIAGATIGARIGGTARREAWAVGFGMNARGAMEMVLATVAREHGLIDGRLFVALVTMAVVTSLVSGPMLARLVPPVSPRTPS